MDSKSSDLPKSTEIDIKPETETSTFDFEDFKKRVKLLEDQMNEMKSRMTEPKEQKKRDDKNWAKPTEVKRDLNTSDTSGMKGESSRTPARSTDKRTLSNLVIKTYRKHLVKCVDIIIQEQLEHILMLGSDLDIEYYERRLVEFKKLYAEGESKGKQQANGQADPCEVDDEIAEKENTKIEHREIATPDNKENSDVIGEFVNEGPKKCLLGSFEPEEIMKKGREKKKDELITLENKTESAVKDIPTDNASRSASEQMKKCVEQEVDELVTQLNEIEPGPENGRILIGSQFDIEPYEKRVIEMKKLCVEHSSKVKQCAHGIHSPEAVATEFKLDDDTIGTTNQESTKIKDTAIATPKDIPTDHSPNSLFHVSVREEEEKNIRLKH